MLAEQPRNDQDYEVHSEASDNEEDEILQEGFYGPITNQKTCETDAGFIRSKSRNDDFCGNRNL